MMAHCHCQHYHHSFAAVRNSDDGDDHCSVSCQNCYSYYSSSSCCCCTHLDVSFVHQKSHHHHHLFGCHPHWVDDGVDTRKDVEEDIHLQQIVVLVVVASSLGRDTVEVAHCHQDNHVGEEVEAPLLLLDLHIVLPAAVA